MFPEGFKPSVFGFVDQCVIQLHYENVLFFVPLAGFEPATKSFEDFYSIIELQGHLLVHNDGTRTHKPYSGISLGN